MTRRGGAGAAALPSSSARRQKRVRVRTEKVNFLVGSRAAIGVLYGPAAAREAAPAACAGSLRLWTPFSVVRCLSGGTRAAGHGLGKEAHETVSWEKAARRPAVSSRSSTLPSARDDPVRVSSGVVKEPEYLFRLPMARAHMS